MEGGLTVPRAKMTVRGVQPVSLVMSSAVLPPEYSLLPPVLLLPPPLPLVGCGAAGADEEGSDGELGAGTSGMEVGEELDSVVELEPESMHQYWKPQLLVQRSRLLGLFGAAEVRVRRAARAGSAMVDFMVMGLVGSRNT